MSNRGFAQTTAIPVAQAPDMTCAQAAQLLTANQFADEDDKFLAEMKRSQCEVLAYNQRHASDPPAQLEDNQQVAYFTQDTSDPDGKRVLFSMMTLKQAKQAETLCKVLAGGYIADAAPTPALSVLAGVAGTYSCDAYFDAAVRSDPMLIVMPGLVPSIKMTKEILAHARNTAQTLAQDYKAKPADILLAATPGGEGKILVAVGNSVGGVPGHALTTVGNAMQKAQTTAEHPVVSAAKGVCRAFIRHKC
jgi:hypothetical protein